MQRLAQILQTPGFIKKVRLLGDGTPGFFIHSAGVADHR